MRVSLPSGESRAIRVPLDATRLDLAIAEAEKKRTEKRSGEIHLPGKRPTFANLAEQYLESGVLAEKKKSTQEDESQSLKMWIEHLGGTRVDWIEPSQVSAFMEKRLKAGASARTVNKNLSAFNNCMNYGKTLEGKPVKKLPEVERLQQKKPRKRPFLSPEQVELLLEKATASKNTVLMRLYIRFLASSGCREQEALKIRKEDVDMKRGVVTVGADGDTKNSLSREIQFNDALRQVLSEILATLPPDCTWLFPSPQRGKKDIHAQSLRESFYQIRREAGLSWVGFHDLRHYFASKCVMAGIDFMTISEWLGHQDGGILVGKTYGHLNDEHKRQAAAKLKL
jgi:integrase